MRRQLVVIGAVVSVGMGAAGCRSVIPSEATPAPIGPSAEAPPSPRATAAHQATPYQRLPCQKLGYTERDEPFNPPPIIKFCNNTSEPLVIRRLDMEGLKEVTVLPDQLAVTANGGPVMGRMTDAELLAGPGLMFGVFGEDGKPRGRFLYLPEPLLDPIQPNWTCLSMASEPPFVMRHGTDFPEICPSAPAPPPSPPQ